MNELKMINNWLTSAAYFLQRGWPADGVFHLLGALRYHRHQTLNQIIHHWPNSPLAACAHACEQGYNSIAQSTQSPLTDNAPISVIICSREESRFASAQAQYQRALANGWFEIIRIPDARSLSEGYNRGLAQAQGDIIIFSHDDVWLLADDFRSELLAALQTFDLVGVAGATQLAGPTWFSCDPLYRRQWVSYPNPDQPGGFFCHRDGPWGPRWYGDIQCLDGVFMAVRRERLGALRFDATRYHGFHLYDLDFSHRAFQQGLRLGVCPRLSLVHASKGGFNDNQWRYFAEIFCQQYQLPLLGRPATRSWLFDKEQDLRVFLAANFAWQDQLGQGIPPAHYWQTLASQQPSKTLLHIGAGRANAHPIGPAFATGQWQIIYADTDPTQTPDILVSLLNLTKLATASVDGVFLSYLLERLYWHELPKVLQEIARILKPGGFCLAWAFDLQAAAQWIAQDKLFEVIGQAPFGPLTPFDMVFNHRHITGIQQPGLAHHTGFTMTTLAQAFQNSGFASVCSSKRTAGLDLQVLATPSLIPGDLLQTLASIYFSESTHV